MALTDTVMLGFLLRVAVLCKCVCVVLFYRAMSLSFSIQSCEGIQKLFLQAFLNGALILALNSRKAHKREKEHSLSQVIHKSRQKLTRKIASRDIRHYV